MENNTEPEVQCDNCGKKIPESKSFLHEAYCRRNVIRCLKCNEPIDKAEMEQHELEAHKLTACKHCKKEFEAKSIESHQNSCNMKPKLCQYCNCDVSATEYAGHVNTCGSRTKKCITCNKNILLRDFDTHEAVCVINQNNYEKSFPGLKEEPKKVEPVRQKPTEPIAKPRPEVKSEKLVEPIYKPIAEPKKELAREYKNPEVIKASEVKGQSAAQMKPDYQPKDAARLEKPYMAKDPRTDFKMNEIDPRGGLNIRENIKNKEVPNVGISLDPTSNKPKDYFKDQKPSHKPINQSIPIDFKDNISGSRQKPMIFDHRETSINNIPSSVYSAGTDFSRVSGGMSGLPGKDYSNKPVEKISSNYKVGELASMNKQGKPEPKNYGIADPRKATGPSSGTTKYDPSKYDPRDKGSYKENKSTNSTSTRPTKPNGPSEMDAIIARQMAEGKYNEFDEEPQGFEDYDTEPVRMAANREEEIMQKAIEESLRAQKKQQVAPRNDPQPSRNINTGYVEDIPPEILAESEDLELQRALKESLESQKGRGGGGGVSSYKPGDTLNSEEFKRAIALSKIQK